MGNVEPLLRWIPASAGMTTHTVMPDVIRHPYVDERSDRSCYVLFNVGHRFRRSYTGSEAIQGRAVGGRPCILKVKHPLGLARSDACGSVVDATYRNKTQTHRAVPRISLM